MATRQTGMTVETAVPLSRAVVESEVARQLAAREAEMENEDDEIEMTSADRVSEMLQSDLGDRAYVRVYKMDDRSGQFEFCKDYTPQEFETNGNELIRTEWGYGKFRVVLYGNVPGTKRFTIRAKNDLSFAKPLTPTAVAVVPQQQNSELSQVLAALVDGQNKLLQALTAQPHKSAREELKETLELMTLMRPPETQKSSISEIVEAIKEMKGVSELISGKEEKDDPTSQMLSLGGEIIGLVKNGMGGGQPAQGTQPFPQLSVPASLTAPAENPIQPPVSYSAATAIDPEDDEMLEQLLFVNKLKKQFIPLAGDDTKIEEAALFLDEKTPESLDGLLTMMEQPTWFELLQTAAPQYLPALVPVVTTHREWLTKVRDRLLELLKEED